MRPLIRYTAASDGIRLAYSLNGRGPPLVRTPTWLNHLEHDWDGPTLRHWLTELSSGHLLLRYDVRGCGLSEWTVDDLSFEACVRDLQSIVDAAGLERFSLIGTSLGAAIAIAFAARHPERVLRMVLCGSFCRGRLKRGQPGAEEKAQILLKLIEQGWGRHDEAFLNVFTGQFLPGGTREQWLWFTEHMRLATSAANAVRLSREIQHIDVQEDARRVRCPVLVFHSKHDAVVPYEEGQLTAMLIPAAQFISLESANHTILPDEPAWAHVVAEIRRFLAPSVEVQETQQLELTRREREVLNLLTAGLTHSEIAAALGLTSKTVRNVASALYAKLRVTNRLAAAVRGRSPART